MKNLIPTNSQKSFYGKAKVIYDDSAILLKSYNTIVCKIDKGEFTRTWGGYSATTMKHINSFRETYGMPRLSKADWDKLTVA